MSKVLRNVLALALGVALVGTALLRVPTTRAAGEQCFTETNQCIRGAFLDYWQQNGGLAINGYPLTDQRVETLEDGRAYTVQYFERVRMEYHPENAQASQVLLGQFGRAIHPADPPVAASGDGTFYPETGHNIGGAFLTYWKGHGGLAQFGYPLTELISEKLEDGNTYQVQYFERARFELHPENAAPYDVLLGQFGRRILATATPANFSPCAASNLAIATEGDAGAGQRFGTVYMTNTGGQACTLSGTPQVQLLDGAGNPLDVNYADASQPSITILVLPPSEIATFTTRWTNWCGANPGKAQVRVTLPNGGTFTTDAPGTPPCLGQGQPSTFGANPFAIDGTSAHANVILRFYKAINAQDYRAAYNLLGAERHAAQSYDAFAAGYANTGKVTVVIGAINGATGPEVNRIAVTLTSTMKDGTTQQFTGTYDVGVDGGTLKILDASINAGLPPS